VASTVQLSLGAIQSLLNSPQGPVAMDMMRRGRKVEALAKRLAPVDTGRLAGSIVTVQINVGGKPGAGVGTNVEYALYVHDGTRAHPIAPKRAKVLRFKAGGSVVFTSKVNHPGTKAVPFLENALVAAAG
jgi:hypothetical protein